MKPGNWARIALLGSEVSVNAVVQTMEHVAEAGATWEHRELTVGTMDHNGVRTTSKRK